MENYNKYYPISRENFRERRPLEPTGRRCVDEWQMALTPKKEKWKNKKIFGKTEVRRKRILEENGQKHICGKCLPFC
jgi:hypothetical protein